MRPLASLALALVLAGCMSPTDGGPTETSMPSTSTSLATTSPAPPPEWNLTLPALPTVGGEPANQWVRGGDLEEGWNVEAKVGEGWFQLVWLISDTDRDPPPGYSCGASMGTQTDFDVVNRAVRTIHDDLVRRGSVALLSRSSRDESTSCGGKHHVSIDAAGNGSTRDGPYHEPLPVFVAANGSALIERAGLWLAPGETAVVRVDRWENETGGSTPHASTRAGLQPAQAESVHVTGLTRIVHLGAWSTDRIWVIPANVCGNEPDVEDRSNNCVDRGSGP